MSRKTHADYLAGVPARIRDRLLAPGTPLEPGAIAAVGRFCTAVKARQEPLDAPSRASFEAAAKSESTLATLLRTLERHVPEVGTAAGRALRREWYNRRPQSDAPRRKGKAPLPPAAPAHWPVSWRSMYSALLAAPTREPTKRRHVASIDRCARLVGALDAGTELTFYLGYCLAERFEAETVGLRAVAVYLGGLIALGKAGGAEAKGLAGLRFMQHEILERAELTPKAKEERLKKLEERGGYGFILQSIVTLLETACAAPAHSAEAEQARQNAAILALVVNIPARTGDVAGWRLGHDLVRAPSGAWRLGWTQGKTDHDAQAGTLWPEVSPILDELILAGRPDRFVHLRYEQLAGLNWLTLSPEAFEARLPSARVKTEIGVPLHDLRTLAADFLRRMDPAAARTLISGLLGHKTAKAGEAYRRDCDGDAATRDWLGIRKRLAG